MQRFVGSGQPMVHERSGGYAGAGRGRRFGWSGANRTHWSFFHPLPKPDHGPAPGRPSTQLSKPCSTLICEPIDADVGRRAGEYLRRYRKSHPVEPGDALIAATAVSSGALLRARNRKRYPMPELAFYR